MESEKKYSISSHGKTVKEIDTQRDYLKEKKNFRSSLTRYSGGSDLEMHKNEIVFLDESLT